MRVFFLGQGPLGERVFEHALKQSSSDFRIVGASSNSNTDKAWWGTANIQKLCRSQAISFVPNEKRNEDLLAAALTTTKAELIMSVGHPWILSPRILDIVAGNAVNLHPAPLPEFGGFNTLSHAILENSPTFGVTLHWARAEVDTGDIIKLQLFKIPRNITAKELHSLVVECGTEVGLDFIANARVRLDATETNIKGKPCRLFARSSLDQYREITDLANTEEVSRRSRACYFPPFPPAFIAIEGRNIQLVPGVTEDFQDVERLYKRLRI